MSSQLSAAERSYSPLYFLAALGAGGLAVTFFMYLMFWVPHPGQPVPVFEDIAAYLATASLLGQSFVIFAMAGIAVFTVLHVWLLVWNLQHLAHFKATDAYKKLHSSNAETQLKAVPLTLAMTINVSFIVGLVFVPGLWNIVEYLFPFALLGFLAIGIFAFRLLGRFFGRVLTGGGFNPKANNSFAQLLPAFALGMIGVGLAAPSAMSQTGWIVATSLTLSTFFVVTALLITVVALVQAILPMVQHGTAPEAAPTLMIVVPILTVIGIALMRMNHGLHTSLEVHAAAGETFMMLTQIVSVQVLFGLLGLLVLRRQNYVKTFLSSAGKRSAGSYALVCPGVALSVMLHFWVNKGLVSAGIVEKFSAAYWIATTPALLLQFAMIVLVFQLHRLHFSKGNSVPAGVPA